MRRITLALAIAIISTPALAWREGAGYLELADRLDRPEDGYCLDVPGSGGWVDFSAPLNAHNCKGPAFFADEAVRFDRDPGPIRFPAYEGCVTAAGLNGRSLPGAALTLKPCAEDPDVAEGPFAARSLQSFTHRADGRIALEGSGLCLVVGAESATTFSADHRWRPLFLDRCETAPAARSVWKRFAARE